MRYSISLLLVSLACFALSCGSGGDPTIPASDENAAFSTGIDRVGDTRPGPGTAEDNDAGRVPNSKKAQVVMNCKAVREAAEAFAADNDGVYPTDTRNSKTPSGKTMIDYLPDGRHLVNPYTGQATEPVDGHACNPGETGYVPSYCPGVARGYWVTGVVNEFNQTVVIMARSCDGETVEIVGRGAQ